MRRASSDFELGDPFLQLNAKHDHAFGETCSDPTIALCWDADRLDIGRVGIAPDPIYFSTETARALAASGRRLHWADGPPDWHELAVRFGLG